MQSFGNDGFEPMSLVPLRIKAHVTNFHYSAEHAARRGSLVGRPKLRRAEPNYVSPPVIEPRRNSGASGFPHVSNSCPDRSHNEFGGQQTADSVK